MVIGYVKLVCMSKKKTDLTVALLFHGILMKPTLSATLCFFPLCLCSCLVEGLKFLFVSL